MFTALFIPERALSTRDPNYHVLSPRRARSCQKCSPRRLAPQRKVSRRGARISLLPNRHYAQNRKLRAPVNTTSRLKTPKTPRRRRRRAKTRSTFQQKKKTVFGTPFLSSRYTNARFSPPTTTSYTSPAGKPLLRRRFAPICVRQREICRRHRRRRLPVDRATSSKDLKEFFR